MYLKVGQQAPNFTLNNYDGEKISFNNLKGTAFILWFFPKANTPG